MHIRIEHLKKHFGGVYALDGFSCVLEQGKIIGIVGPNGSGKSTFVNTLTGMFSATGGTIHFDGAALSSVIPWDLPTYGVTRTFQEVRLFEQMTVLDNILVVLTDRHPVNALFERHTSFHFSRAEELLKKVDLWEKRAALARTCSYGQRKLLEIARACAMDPKAVLFDEPFAGLFPEMIKIVKQIMKELRDNGVAVVLIEHNMDLIRELSDHTIVLDAGRLLAEGTPDAVLKKKEVIEAYLGE